jgi:hypothetical protein
MISLKFLEGCRMALKLTSLDIDRQVAELMAARERGEHLSPGQAMIAQTWPQARSATALDVPAVEKALKAKGANNANTFRGLLSHLACLVTGEYGRRAQELADQQSLCAYMQMTVIADQLDAASRGARSKQDLMIARAMTFNGIVQQEMHQKKLELMARQALQGKTAALTAKNRGPKKSPSGL